MTRPAPATAPEIDTSRPDPARIYDYVLGGKDHFAADRDTAETVATATGPLDLGRAGLRMTALTP